MKTKIYNNLIFSLLFVCSICGLFGGVGVSAQASEETSPTTQSIRRGNPPVLHLYSSIWGEDTIKTTGTNQEAVSGLIRSFFTRFLSIIFTISGILMVIMLAVHGTQMIYAEFTGNVPGFSNAKNRVKAAAIGTIILLLSWIILDFIDPDLLRPKLFTTITKLREIGASNNLISFDLVVPDDAISYNEDTNKLTIRACPRLKEGSNFKAQVENIETSLQGTRQFHYQILHSNLIDNEAFVYDPEGKEGERSVLYGSLADKSRDRNNFVGIIDCPDSSGNPPGEIEIENSDNIVVFPIVSISVIEEVPKPNTDPPEKIKKKVVKKFWRGQPWKYEPEIDADDCINLGKGAVKLSKAITLAKSGGVTDIINNDKGGVITIDFPAIKKPGHIAGTKSTEEIVTGYHIDNKEVKYCAVKNLDTCPSGQGGYKSANKSEKIEFRVTGNTAGNRLVAITDSFKESIFRITPMLAGKDGKKIGQCKEPLRGKTTCFKMTRDNNDDVSDVIKLSENNCFDTSIKGSAKSQEELAEYIKRVITYPGEVTPAADVRADSPFPGHSFTYFTLGALNTGNWDEEVWGGHPFRSGSGRTGMGVRFNITVGNVFFKHATQDKPSKTAYRTNWKSTDREVIYFKGAPTRFCITPTVVRGKNSYELKTVCRTPPASQ